MRASSAFLWAVGVVYAVLGCDGGGSTSSSLSGDPTAAQAPLRGKDLSQAGQLVGTWVATSEGGDFECLEFLKEAKALLGDGGAGVTVDYSVLEGGRLSLVLPGGMTAVFKATLAGDQLELDGKASALASGGKQRFRRLRSGETCADALKARARAAAEAYQRRVTLLNDFLAQPGLVLAFTDAGASTPASIALEIAAAGGQFSGKAWHDDKPPHLNAISGRLELNERAHFAQVLVTYGQRIAPPAARPDGGGNIALNVEGEGKALRISGKVTIGGAGPAFELVLRSDPALHAAIVKRYEAELARIESLKQPLISLLKDYAVLRGRVHPADARKIEPDTVDLTLVRDRASGQYVCEGVMIGMRDRGELVTRAAAEIVVADGRPWLRIVCPPAREYMLSLASQSGVRLTGQWMMPGSGQGKSAEFEVVEALEPAAREARFAAWRQAIKALGRDAVFTGLVQEDSALGLEMPIGLRLQLTVQPDGSLTGAAHYPAMSTRLAVAGQVAETTVGPRLQLTYAAAETTPGDQIFFRSVQRGMWSFVPVGNGDTLELKGFFTGPPLRLTTLTRLSDASKARLRKKLVEALRSGGQFYLARFVGWQTPGQTPTVVDWKLEGTDRISGKVLTAGRPIGANEKVLSTYEGEVTEDDGWLSVHLTQVSHWAENNKFVTGLELLVAEDSSGVLHLSGPTIGIGAVRDGKRVAETAPAKGHPVCFIPAAAADAATRAGIDKAIADVEKTRADAAAQAEAERLAALEARRAKMAPYFPLFQAPTGCVITTDVPAEMGAVLLRAEVDAASATISGAGIDLREMPFREFTFDADLDKWGNLTISTSLEKTSYAFANPTPTGASSRSMALTLLAEAERTRLEALIDLGRRLGSATPGTLTVETLDAAAAKAREPTLAASSMPGIAIYKQRRNDQVAAMFTARSNGRYRWSNEPVTLRLSEPVRGSALYIKGGGPTNGLTVVINGVHRASIASIAQLGAALVGLPRDLEILEVRLEAGPVAQARGVVLLP